MPVPAFKKLRKKALLSWAKEQRHSAKRVYDTISNNTGIIMDLRVGQVLVTRSISIGAEDFHPASYEISSMYDNGISLINMKNPKRFCSPDRYHYMPWNHFLSCAKWRIKK